MVARHAKNVDDEARTAGSPFWTLASCTLHDNNCRPDWIGWPTSDAGHVSQLWGDQMLCRISFVTIQPSILFRNWTKV